VLPEAKQPPRNERGELVCSYCGSVAIYFSHSRKFYWGKDYGPVWACIPCDARVGCHPGTNKPLGRLANESLRVAKQQAHASFDPLWKRKMAVTSCHQAVARKGAYRWLAAQLGIEENNCHMGYMNEAMCAKVVETCSPYIDQEIVPF
jgi:hypothetical protein